MHPTHVDRPGDLVVIGLPLRTSPERAAADIPAHWQRFMRDDVAAKVAVDPDDACIYAVYCDYESDFRGPYTMVLGVAVEPASPVPAGLRRVRVPAGRYAVFAAKGDPAQVIWATWRHVNEAWRERAGRRYIADFERYRREASALDPAEAEVVVGLV